MRLILSTLTILLSNFFFQQPVFHANGMFLFQSQVTRITPVPGKRAGSGSARSPARTQAPIPHFPGEPNPSPGTPLGLAQMERSGGTLCVTAPVSGQPALFAAGPVPPAAAAVSRRTRTAGGINGELQTAAGSALLLRSQANRTSTALTQGCHLTIKLREQGYLGSLKLP